MSDQLEDYFAHLVQTEARTLGSGLAPDDADKRELVRRLIDVGSRVAHAMSVPCSSCDALGDYESRFCIESDYADDDGEDHPVGSALMRMHARIALLQTKLARADEELVVRQLDCPTCRRNFGEVMVPKHVALTYKLHCRGCELEGRRA